jgi:tetratricopeptide (TPR) repeat protein
MNLFRFTLFFLAIGLGFAEDCASLLPALERAAAQQSQSVQALMNLGVNSFRCGQPSRALGPLQKAAELEPANSSAYFYLGVSLLALDRDEEAKNAFRRMASLSPADADQLFLLQKGYSRLSAALLERMAEMAPESPRLNQVRAEMLDLEHQPERAIQEYKKAIQKAPQVPAFHYALACLYWGQFQTVDALSEFQRVIELDPSHYMAHYKAGMALIELDRLQSARQELQRTVALQPGLANAHFGLAKIYWKTQQPAQALSEVDACLKLDSANNSAQYLRYQILLKLGRKSEAEAQMKRLPVLQRAPEPRER